MILRALPIACVVFAGLLSASTSFAAERQFAISDFDHVQVFGPFRVDIQTGRATSVTASGDPDALDALSVTSNSGMLTIQTVTRSRSSWKEEPHAAARVTIFLPQLKGVRLLGSGTISAAEVRGIANDVTLNGSGQIILARLTSDNATIRLNGSGQIKVAGTAKNLTADIRGSGDLDASGLAVSDIKIVAATTGRVMAKSMRTADVKQSGAGDVHVAGTPSCLVENTGSGTASCGD